MPGSCEVSACNGLCGARGSIGACEMARQGGCPAAHFSIYLHRPDQLLLQAQRQEQLDADHKLIHNLFLQLAKHVELSGPNVAQLPIGAVPPRLNRSTRQ